MRNRLIYVISMVVLFLVGFISGCLFEVGFEGGEEKGNGSMEYEEHDFYNPPPTGWVSIGAGTDSDYQQTFCYGDFDNDGVKELVGSYSHSAVGIFIHEKTKDGWSRSVLHPKFDPSLTHIKGMDGGWPVKGLVSGDFDGDGFDEIISMADAINYPPVHGNGSDTIPFPGCIYIDWIDGKGFMLKIPEDFASSLKNYLDKEVIFGIRPEDVYLERAPIPSNEENSIPVTEEMVEPLGTETLVHLNTPEPGNQALVSLTSREAIGLNRGEKKKVTLDLTKMHAFEKDTEKAIV